AKTVSIRALAIAHRRQSLGLSAALSRQLTDLPRGSSGDAVADDSQRRGRCGAVVPGNRVLPGATPSRQRSLHVHLQRREAWSTEAHQSEGLHTTPTGILRSLPEGRPRTGVDGKRHPLLAARKRKGKISNVRRQTINPRLRSCHPRLTLSRASSCSRRVRLS